jgi:hypothetical protein
MQYLTFPALLTPAPICCAPIRRSVPGFVNQTIFGDTIEPGCSWRPYGEKNTASCSQWPTGTILENRHLHHAEATSYIA